MKKFLITIILLLSCIGVFSQTTLNPSGTWTAARNIINANFSDTYDSLAVHQLRLSAVDDSIASHLLRLIAVEDSIGELRTSIGSGTGVEVDSSVYATRHYTSSTFATIANPVFTGIQKVSTTDTLATQSYARSYGGTGTVTVGDVRDEIADSLNALRPAMLVGDGTVGPFFDGSSDGGQMLYFYGDNGFYTALQGGAPTANRSYRLPIAALPSAGNKAYLNIDQYGNMGFIDTTLVGNADSSIYATKYWVGASATAASVTGFTPASGSLTLAGADAITLTTTNTTALTLPTTGTLATTSDLGSYALSSHSHALGDITGSDVDSAVVIDNKLAFFVGSDTASLHINTNDIVDLSDYAPVLSDWQRQCGGCWQE